MQPYFSIFTPVYNAEEYIPQFIESVLSQTFQDFEIYLFDDGSEDGSADICSKYAEMDHRIIIKTGEYVNSIDAMNAFIGFARGKYLVFIDDDDYWEKDYLALVYRKIEDTEADCAITSYTLVDSKGTMLGWYTPSLRDGKIMDASEAKREFLTSLNVEGFRWNKIYRKEIVQKSKERFPHTFPADILTEYKWLGLANRIVYVDTKGYFYRQSNTSEVANVDINKCMGMLSTILCLNREAVNDGLQEEALFYKTWRYCDVMYNYIVKSKLSRDVKRKLISAYSWDGVVGKSLINVLLLFRKYDSLRDNHLKFAIKSMIVWWLC